MVSHGSSLVLTFDGGLGLGSTATSASSSSASSSSSSSGGITFSLLSSGGSLSDGLGSRLSGLELLIIGLNLVLRDGFLVSDVGNISGLLGEGDGEHGDLPGELEVVQSLEKGLVFIDELVLLDLVHLVETLEPVLDELRELNYHFHSVGDTSDDNLFVCFFSVEEEVHSLEVPSDGRARFDSDLVVGEGVGGSGHFSIGFRHLIYNYKIRY
jgi:hypothetical protein